MKQSDWTNRQRDKKSPFKVPEGYFEDFTTKLMQQLPEEESLQEQETPTLKKGILEPKVTLLTRIKPYFYLAATICGLAFGIKVYKYQQQYFTNKEEVSVVSMTDKQAQQYVEDVCDFAMIDDGDVYACATGNL